MFCASSFIRDILYLLISTQPIPSKSHQPVAKTHLVQFYLETAIVEIAH